MFIYNVLQVILEDKWMTYDANDWLYELCIFEKERRRQKHQIANSNCNQKIAKSIHAF